MSNDSKNNSNEESFKKTLDNNNKNKKNRNGTSSHTNKDATIKMQTKSLVVQNKNKFEEKAINKMEKNNKNKNENQSIKPKDEFSKYNNIFIYINIYLLI